MVKRIAGLVSLVAMLICFVGSVAAEDTITWWVGSWKYEDGRAQRIASSFEQENPGVKVNIVPVPWEGYHDKLMSALLSRNVPDVLMIPSAYSQAFVATGSLLDVTDVLDEMGRDKFTPVALKWTQFQGRDYGFPYRAEGFCLFYNTRMFREAGLSHPPKTWDEVAKATVALTKDTDGDGVIDVYGLGLPLSMRTPEHAACTFRWVLGSYGGDFVNETATEATMNTSEAITVLKWFQDLFRAKAVPLSSLENDLDQVRRLFGAEKVAMQLNAVYACDAYAEEVPDLEYEVVLMPGATPGEIGKSEILGWSIGVSAFTPRKDLALRFAEHFLRPENVAWLTDALPAVKAASSDPRFAAPHVQVFIEQLDHAIPDIPLPNIYDINEAVTRTLQRLFLEELDVERVAGELNAEIQKALNKR